MSLNNSSSLFANNKNKNPWLLFKGFGMDIYWICKSNLHNMQILGNYIVLRNLK